MVTNMLTHLIEQHGRIWVLRGRVCFKKIHGSRGGGSPWRLMAREPIQENLGYAGWIGRQAGLSGVCSVAPLSQGADQLYLRFW